MKNVFVVLMLIVCFAVPALAQFNTVADNPGKSGFDTATIEATGRIEANGEHRRVVVDNHGLDGFLDVKGYEAFAVGDVVRVHVHKGEDGCTCPAGCPCASGGKCTNPGVCPQHHPRATQTTQARATTAQRQVAAYRATDGRTYRVRDGVAEVYTQTCSGNKCSGSWAALGSNAGSCASCSGATGDGFRLRNLLPRNR